MTDELKNKLTERFAVIMKESNLDTDKPLDDAVYDGMLKAYLAGGEHGYECMMADVNEAKRRSFENGWKAAIEKACEWLCDHLGAPVGMPQAKSYNAAIAELCSEFRKGMEE